LHVLEIGRVIGHVLIHCRGRGGVEQFGGAVCGVAGTPRDGHRDAAAAGVVLGVGAVGGLAVMVLEKMENRRKCERDDMIDLNPLLEERRCPNR
jgi:hypothetical protein